VPVGHQDHGPIPVAIAVVLGGLDQPFDLRLGQGRRYFATVREIAPEFLPNTVQAGVLETYRRISERQIRVSSDGGGLSKMS
jgi:hypothetical protein